MLPTHRIAVLTEDGKLLLDALPFRAGERVEITVSATQDTAPTPHPLQGTVLSYDRPTDAVAESDWSATQ